MFTAEILENTKKGKKINFHHRQDFLIFKYTHWKYFPFLTKLQFFHKLLEYAFFI